MRRMLTFVAPILLAGTILSFPKLAMAQRGGTYGGAPHGTGASPRATFARPVYGAAYSASPRLGVRIPVAQGSGGHRIVGPGRQQGTSTMRTRHTNIVPFDNFGEADFQDVPGLGFDFPHLAAVSGHQHFGHRRFGENLPFGFGGFFLPTEPVIIEEAQPAAAPQSESDFTGEASDIDPTRESRSNRRGSAQSSSAPAESSSAAPAEAQPDAAEYVFVRLDGGLLFAVAYSWQNATLRYITRDGMRRSVASEALDLSATEQFNEQRGLTFHLPA
jgi:hypothetical protein